MFWYIATILFQNAASRAKYKKPVAVVEGRKVYLRKRKGCCAKVCCVFFPFLLGLSVLFLAVLSLGINGGEFGEVRPDEDYYATRDLAIFIPTWVVAVFLSAIGVCFVYFGKDRKRGLLRAGDSYLITPPYPEPFWVSFPLNGADFVADFFGTLLIAPAMPIYWQVTLVLSLTCAFLINIYLYCLYKAKRAELTFQDIKTKLGMLIILSSIEDVIQLVASITFLIDQQGDIDGIILEAIAISFSAVIGWCSFSARMVEAPFFLLFGREIYVQSKTKGQGEQQVTPYDDSSNTV